MTCSVSRSRNCTAHHRAGQGRGQPARRHHRANSRKYEGAQSRQQPGRTAQRRADASTLVYQLPAIIPAVAIPIDHVIRIFHIGILHGLRQGARRRNDANIVFGKACRLQLIDHRPGDGAVGIKPGKGDHHGGTFVHSDLMATRHLARPFRNPNEFRRLWFRHL
ncbi:MAG: hypothetical protein JF627_03535 [Alphaproteobacteria bacterium]|nr:hypothetical protein [Alphaproteobacteria bacterium]